VAVDQNAKTFTLAGKQRSHVFKVTESTTITKAGAAATITDIVQNEEARGLHLKNADGTLETKRVKIGPRTEGEKKARKSKKAAATAEGSPGCFSRSFTKALNASDNPVCVNAYYKRRDQAHVLFVTRVWQHAFKSSTWNLCGERSCID
jgi:hypothetical protein